MPLKCVLKALLELLDKPHRTIQDQYLADEHTYISPALNMFRYVFVR